MFKINKTKEKASIRNVFTYWETLLSEPDEYDWNNDPDGLRVVCYPSAPVWFNKLFSYFQEREFLKCIRLIGDIKGKKILEIGCGTGRWIKLMSKNGGIVTGIDIQRKIIEHDKRYLPDAQFFYGNFLEYDFGENKFDLIVSITFLQHIPYSFQSDAIKKIATLLKKGGKVILIENIFDHGTITFSNKTDDWIRLFENSGFECIYKKGINYHLLLFFLWRLRNYFIGRNKRRPPPFSLEKRQLQRENFFKIILESLIYKPVVYLSYPFEYLFIFLPERFALHSAFIFERKCL